MLYKHLSLLCPIFPLYYVIPQLLKGDRNSTAIEYYIYSTLTAQSLIVM